MKHGVIFNPVSSFVAFGEKLSSAIVLSLTLFRLLVHSLFSRRTRLNLKDSGIPKRIPIRPDN